MPKGKGGKNKRKGKKTGEITKRQLEFREEGQEYGRVIKMLGDGRLQAVCSDGETRICHIRGKMRKRVWIRDDDLILVDIRSYQEDKGDVVYKYTPDEDKMLQAYGELTGGTSKKDEEENNDDDLWGDDSEDSVVLEQSTNSSSEKDMETLIDEL